MAERIRWGILGCARIARRGLIPGIAQSQRGRLLAIASRDQSKAQSWAGEFDIPRGYGSYEALIDDPEIQAVYIPLPNELHRPWTLRAAAAGKHVLCDKPLGLDASEAEEMVAACRGAGVLLMEAFMWRHQPRTRRALELVRNGDIGELRLVRSSFSFDIDRADWRLDPARGGGALWDVGCYGINTCRLFCAAEAESVTAAARRWQTGVDMTLAATMRFGDGVIGQIDCSFEVPFRCSYELVGTGGVIEVPLAYLPGPEPIVRLRQANEDQILTAPALDQYAEMVDHFSAAVAAGGSLDWPAEDGLANMRLLDRVAAAARLPLP